MQYGSVVTVLNDGIRISEDQLEPIGIFDQSECWGVWLPDPNWSLNDGKQPPEHLVVSPFPPSSWPLLFRVELKLDDTAGTLSDALKVLNDEGFNILGIQGTPTGHRHATVTIIGESVEIKVKKSRLLLERGDFPEETRDFKNKALQSYIHTQLAPEMLGYSDRIRTKLLEADKNSMFLRSTFLDPGHPQFGSFYQDRYKQGLLYSLDRFDDPKAKGLSQEQHIPAVTCRWLQNLAFFWLYGRSANDNDAERFEYKSFSWTLKPKQERACREFGARVAIFKPPFRTIAAFNLDEDYVRLMLSDRDLPDRTAFVKLTYQAAVTRASTKGFQYHIYNGIKDSLILRSVSLTTNSRSNKREDCKLYLLASRKDNIELRKQDNKGPFDEAKAKISAAVTAATTYLTEQGCTISVEPEVAPLRSRILFFSTRFEWLAAKEPLYDDLVREAAKWGFKLITDWEQKRDALVEMLTQGETKIDERVLKIIRGSDALALLIPESVLKEDPAKHGPEAEGLHWLLYEYGIAKGLNKKCVVYVDGDRGVSEYEWGRILKVSGNVEVQKFSSRLADELLLKDIARGFHALDVKFRSTHELQQ